MHSVLRKLQKIDTFEKLSEQNATIFLSSSLAENKEHISGIIRLGILFNFFEQFIWF